MKEYKRSNVLIILWVIISLWGIVNIYSASYSYNISELGRLPFMTAIVQLAVFFACFIILIFIVKLKKKSYIIMFKLIDYIFYFANFSLIPLFIVKILKVNLNFGIFGVAERGGAVSVIHLFGLDYQPMELYKIAVILYIAKFFTMQVTQKIAFKSFVIHAKEKSLLRLGLVIAFGIGLIFLQPDFGGAVIVALVCYMMILLSGDNLKLLLKITLIGLIVGAISGIILVKLEIIMPYQISRIENWLNPFPNVLDTGWGSVQSLIAISRGNVFGVGFLNSIQASFLQAGAATDYIFSIISEEWGIFGAIFTILCQVSISLLSMRIGSSAKDRFGLMYCHGFGMLILIQTFTNVGGVSNVIPMTGVTLPFISNGMNSFLFLSLGLFIVVIIDRESRREKRLRYERAQSLFMQENI